MLYFLVSQIADSMQAMKWLVCAGCGTKYERRAAEAQRSTQLGRPSFCSRPCAGSHNRKNLPVSSYDIAPLAGNRRDQFTGLREHLRRCRRRGHPSTITLEDLQAQWLTQDGICPYTGIALQHPSYTHRNNIQTTASLDRIDSSQGYVPGNIQFVSMAVNYAKSTLSHQEMVVLCRRIADFWQSK